MYEDGSNLDDMINNPFKNLSSRKIDIRKQAAPPEKGAFRGASGIDRAAERTVERAVERPEEPAVDYHDSLAGRNHPVELRMLSLEKDVLIAAKRMDDLKRIIENQNERIQLLEEELDILRKELGKEGK